MAGTMHAAWTGDGLSIPKLAKCFTIQSGSFGNISSNVLYVGVSLLFKGKERKKNGVSVENASDCLIFAQANKRINMVHV
jgi:hypothetical protein